MASFVIGSGAVVLGSSGEVSSGTIDVHGTADGFLLGNAGKIIVRSGGTTKNTQINSGGLEYIYAGGSAISTVVNAGGIQQIEDYGGAAYNTIINSGGVVDNWMGVTSGVIINSGGIMATYGRDSPVGSWEASSYDVTINSGGIEIVGKDVQSKYGEYSESYNAKIYGAQFVTDRANASNAIIYNGGSQVATLEGAAENTTVSSGGTLIAVSRGFASDINVSNGGNLIISAGGVVIGWSGTTIIGSGGNLIVSSGASIRGEVTLENGGYATLYAGVKNDSGYPNGSITLAGNTNGGLTISGLTDGGEITTVITVIDSFDGTSAGNSDLIKLAGIHQKDVKNVAYVDSDGKANGDYVTLTLTDDKKITLNIIGAENAGYTLGTASDGSLTYEVCFLEGSMIKILNGEAPIEDIRIGDQVMTLDYENNKEIASYVKWVGNKQTTVKSWLPDDEAGYPVRVVKNAIAEGMPYKDLLITAEHCLFFEGKFIPARMLVNGSTIFYDYSITSYEYYHIETEKHSVIMANGMLTESYLNTGNRHSFRQDGSFVLFSKQSEIKSWKKDASYPLTVERPIVEPLYHEISERAVAMGFKAVSDNRQLTQDPNLHLITVTGQEIYPFSHIDGKYLFNIPLGVEEVCISSRVSRLCDTIGPFVDNRHHLGVWVGDISLVTANTVYKVTDHFSQSDLSGWHPIEKGACRWTKGHAVLPLDHNDSYGRVLVIHILSSNSYFLENDKENDMNYQAIA